MKLKWRNGDIVVAMEGPDIRVTAIVMQMSSTKLLHLQKNTFISLAYLIFTENVSTLIILNFRYRDLQFALFTLSIPHKNLLQMM